MFNYHPIIKIFSVFLLCCEMSYYNYLMFRTDDLAAAVMGTPILHLGVIFYFLVLLFFADYYWRKKLFVILFFWILLASLFCANGVVFMLGNTPPLYLQYSQSGTLAVFSFLLIFTKFKFPNWLRIFSLANLLALIPCVYFYFAKQWANYEVLVYFVCFTPVLKSLVFIDERLKSKPEVIDD